MEYKFSLDYKIEKCKDCPCYFSRYSYQPYGYEHICCLSGKEVLGVYDTKYLSSNLTDDEYEDYENDQDRIDENCRIELFKKCPLKSVKEERQ